MCLGSEVFSAIKHTINSGNISPEDWTKLKIDPRLTDMPIDVFFKRHSQLFAEDACSVEERRISIAEPIRSELRAAEAR